MATGAVRGITFDQCNVSSADDAHYHWIFLNKTNGVTQGCSVTRSGNNITIGKGRFIIFGRFVQIAGAVTINVADTEVMGLPASGTWYCTLVYEIDLTQTNTAETFLQGSFKVLHTTSSSYPTLTQQDLDDGGTIYQYPFARFVAKSSGLSSFVSQLSSINFTDIYNELALNRTQYTDALAEALAGIQDQGWVLQTAYTADNTPEEITVKTTDWALVNGWYQATVDCNHASTAASCVLHITPTNLSGNTAIASMNAETFTKTLNKNVSYIAPDPVLSAKKITFKAYKVPAYDIVFKVTGGSGTVSS